MWNARLVSGLIVASLLFASFFQPSSFAAAPDTELRGAWMWGFDCKDAAAADRLLARAELMKLNALYVLTLYWNGHVAHKTDLAPMSANVTPGFDPIAYLVEAGHRRGIEIHVRIMSGYINHDAPIYVEHPDWKATNVSGRQLAWLNLCDPAARDWETRLVLEAATKYDVDGVQYDYIRFDDTDTCASDADLKRASDALGFDVTTLIYPSLPAIASMQGNPLIKPTTAKVVATFDGGTPAIAVNQLGKGDVVLFNWHAERNPVRAVVTALRNAFSGRGKTPVKTVYVLDSAINAVKYRNTPYLKAVEWVEAFGFESARVEDGGFGKLPVGAVVILPNHYLMTNAQGIALKRHVQNGGRAIFLDSPVFGIKEGAAIRELLGFAADSAYFNRERLLESTAANNGLIPVSTRKVDLAVERERVAQWNRWRMDQVTEVVRVTALGTSKPVTASVYAEKGNADRLLQDWGGWVRDGLVDYVHPMAYVDKVEQLQAYFAWWKEIDPTLARILPGIGAYRIGVGKSPAERARLIGAQIEACRAAGMRGFVLFKLEDIDDALARELAKTVLTGKKPPYHPPSREVRKEK
ncbi:MAG: family 10 glycosylhydrolase [Candidatus Poribacteria bacterium]|nr:family 10 glycosylhydrolase [Candidatus Poribacteria bacterium]